MKEVGDAILVKELTVGPEVTILTDGDELVAKALMMKKPLEEEEEELEAVGEEVAADGVEVITKGKVAEEKEEDSSAE